MCGLTNPALVDSGHGGGGLRGLGGCRDYRGNLLSQRPRNSGRLYACSWMACTRGRALLAGEAELPSRYG